MFRRKAKKTATLSAPKRSPANLALLNTTLFLSLKTQRENVFDFSPLCSNVLCSNLCHHTCIFVYGNVFSSRSCRDFASLSPLLHSLNCIILYLYFHFLDHILYWCVFTSLVLDSAVFRAQTDCYSYVSTVNRFFPF